MVPFVLLLKCASSKICFFSSFLSLCPSGFAFERVARLRQESGSETSDSYWGVPFKIT